MLTFLDDLEYSEAADDTAHLAAPFRAEIEGWEGAFKSERQSRRSVTRAEAVVAVRNGQLDRTTLKFGATLLGEAGGDRKSPSFAASRSRRRSSCGRRCGSSATTLST